MYFSLSGKLSSDKVEGNNQMVNFENIYVGSRVQTSKDGEIFQGTVRYKGGMITREGNWVGVELDKPAGYTSGLFKGHKYFHCNAKHGIFIQPKRLYLIGNWRTMTGNEYRTVNKESYVDETLFAKRHPGTQNEPWQCYDTKTFAFVTPEYIKSTNRTFSVPLTSQTSVDRKINFHKKHIVGHNLSPATTKRTSCNNSGRSSKCSEGTFIPSSPSIPDYHVPRKVFKRMVERDYFGTSLPKRNTLY